eukprot:gene13102-532_t
MGPIRGSSGSSSEMSYPSIGLSEENECGGHATSTPRWLHAHHMATPRWLHARHIAWPPHGHSALVAWPPHYSPQMLGFENNLYFTCHSEIPPMKLALCSLLVLWLFTGSLAEDHENIDQHPEAPQDPPPHEPYKLDGEAEIDAGHWRCTACLTFVNAIQNLLYEPHSGKSVR